MLPYMELIFSASCYVSLLCVTMCCGFVLMTKCNVCYVMNDMSYKKYRDCELNATRTRLSCCLSALYIYPAHLCNCCHVVQTRYNYIACRRSSYPVNTKPRTGFGSVNVVHARIVSSLRYPYSLYLCAAPMIPPLHVIW